MTPVHVALTEETSEFANQQVKSGRFADLSAYIEYLLELDRSRFNEVQLQELLQAGIDSGTPVLADENWWSTRLAKLTSEPRR